MKIYSKIDHKNTTASGKPKIQFYCEHCGRGQHNLDSFFWNSIIPKQDIEGAVADFVDKLNTQQDRTLFPKINTSKKMHSQLCRCDPNIVDIEYVRGVKRAQAILEAGLKQMRVDKE